MLKRFSAAFLVVMYLITSAGFAINLHYCGKKVSTVSVNTVSGCCSKKMTAMKCCHDQRVEIRLTGKSVSIASVNVPPALGLNLFIEQASPNFLSGFSVQPASGNGSFHGPPLFTAQPLFVKNCVFRI